MSKRTSMPLLRAAAMSASLLGCSALGGANPDPEATSRPAHPSSRVRLRGTVDAPAVDGKRGLRIELTSGSSTVVVPVPEQGPWPRPFQLQDADLEGLVLETDHLEVRVVSDTGGVEQREGRARWPLRASHLTLTANRVVAVDDPVVPTRAQLEAFPPATPDEAGSVVDVRGVVVFDARRGPAKSVTLELRAGRGVARIRLPGGASPLPFRIQDTALVSEAPFEVERAKLTAIVDFGGVQTWQDAEMDVDVRASNVVVVPRVREPYIPPPSTMALTPTDLDIRGRIEPPAEGKVKAYFLTLFHGLGSVQIPVEKGAFQLTGDAYADIPLTVPIVQLMLLAQMEDGSNQAANVTVAPTATDVVLKPVFLAAPELPEVPVYGNTKGSRFDRPDTVPAPPRK